MAKRIKIKAGNTSIDMSDELAKMTEELVNKLLPETKRELEKQLDQIKADAANRWLVRSEGGMSPEAQAERTYYALTGRSNKSPAEARAIVNSMIRKGIFKGREAEESSKSKRSKDKLYVQLSITPQFELIGVVGNTAEYAWAIKVGKDTQNTNLATGKRLSAELLWKPVQKKSNDIATVLANETIKTLKK